MFFRERPPGLIQHVLTVLVFGRYRKISETSAKSPSDPRAGVRGILMCGPLLPKSFVFRLSSVHMNFDRVETALVSYREENQNPQKGQNYHPDIRIPPYSKRASKIEKKTLGACAMTTIILDNDIAPSNFILSWRFPRKTAFLDDFPPCPHPKKNKSCFCCLAVSDTHTHTPEKTPPKIRILCFLSFRGGI